ncbi:hypothetical protein SAMN05192562_101370 [Kosakonia arachidis]|uniref:Uncharacterized protein n=1 Tax=Kosakonia arachidis TaxID=551989 RepID=A0A1I6Y7Q3_9ENTR|nr:hypothetical protein SAMN05192562_101370 [Kosakonia arachidis]
MNSVFRGAMLNGCRTMLANATVPHPTVSMGIQMQ